jgi:hypothetical protein
MVFQSPQKNIKISGLPQQILILKTWKQNFEILRTKLRQSTSVMKRLLAEPVPRPQLASDIVEAAAVPAESGGISDLVSQVGSSLGFDRGSPRSTLAPSGLSEQEDARFNLLLQNLTGK